MRRVAISLRAQEDIVDIEAYVAIRAPRAALRLASGIYDRIDQLGLDVHLLFGPHPDVPLPLRRVIHKDYEIFYALNFRYCPGGDRPSR